MTKCPKDCCLYTVMALVILFLTSGGIIIGLVLASGFGMLGATSTTSGGNNSEAVRWSRPQIESIIEATAATTANAVMGVLENDIATEEETTELREAMAEYLEAVMKNSEVSQRHLDEAAYKTDSGDNNDAAPQEDHSEYLVDNVFSPRIAGVHDYTKTKAQREFESVRRAAVTAAARRSTVLPGEVLTRSEIKRLVTRDVSGNTFYREAYLERVRQQELATQAAEEKREDARLFKLWKAYVVPREKDLGQRLFDNAGGVAGGVTGIVAVAAVPLSVLAY